MDFKILCWKAFSAFEVVKKFENPVFDKSAGNSRLESLTWMISLKDTFCIA